MSRNTLTDTLPSCLSLLDAVPGLRCYWQPPHGEDPAQQLAGLRALLPRLAHLHVFHWRMPALERLPLADGATVWPERLRLAAASPEIAAMLEFMRDDSVEQFLEDARTLRGWAKAAQAL
jgi:3-dehydroshikimate dehydratase